ncbi:MAG: hypothetical protein KAQ98_06425 [Bacteriovoracaceae bacterium]|nr:hypothetical protein [Bacteriovoracaceae bacterium]
MIEKMNKLYLIIRNADINEVLSRLQRIGVIHINKTEIEHDGPLEDDLKLSRKIGQFLKFFNNPDTSRQSIYHGDIQNLLDDFNKNTQLLLELKQELAKFEKIEKQLAPWGELDKEKTQLLAQKSGIYFNFYITDTKKFESLDYDNIHTEIINQIQNKIYFVTINKKDTLEDEAGIGLEKIILPDIPLTECREKISHFAREIESTEKKLSDLETYYNYSKASSEKLMDRIDFDTVKIGLEDHHESFSSMTGWFPERRMEYIKNNLEQMENIVYMIEKDIPEDEYKNIPILLRNNAFNRLFEPITKLFSLPAYAELDLTPFFAPFFVMFFGLCLGDAGYGLVIITASIIAMFKFPKARPLLLTLIILGCATAFWGVLTGTFFGINTFETELPGLSRLAVFDSKHIFYLALLIGLFQILFGIIIKCANRWIQFGFQAALSPLGWFILIVFGTFMYLSTQDPAGSSFKLGVAFVNFCKTVPVGVSKTAIVLGILLILFFNDVKANIFIRLGKGLWELYGITGVFGDLLSYIRLFALGISSAILGSVINSIALELLKIPVPGLSHAIFILFVVVGHAGNMGLASLGSFVHPLRLTFVEFYKNSGFTGGGITYSPFKKMYIDDKKGA